MFAAFCVLCCDDSSVCCMFGVMCCLVRLRNGVDACCAHCVTCLLMCVAVSLLSDNMQEFVFGVCCERGNSRKLSLHCRVCGEIFVFEFLTKR